MFEVGSTVGSTVFSAQSSPVESCSGSSYFTDNQNGCIYRDVSYAHLIQGLALGLAPIRCPFLLALAGVDAMSSNVENTRTDGKANTECLLLYLNVRSLFSLLPASDSTT